MNARMGAFHTGLPELLLKIRRTGTRLQILSWQVVSGHVTNTFAIHSLVIIGE